MKRAAYFALFVLLMSMVGATAAEEKKDPAAADKQAIAAAVQSYLKAFAEGDARKIADHWTAEGEFFSAGGRHIKGRQAIEKEFSHYFALHPGEKLKPKREELRFIRPDVVLINGVSELSPPPAGPPSKCTYTAILVKEDGRWLMDHVRETLTFSDSNFDKLSALSWLVGRWTYGGDSPHVQSVDVSCRWSENKNYLVRKYAIRLTHGETLSGTQRIGWDPLAGEVRSWLFAHDGSYDTGVWTKDGDRWIIQTHGYLRDGKKTTAVNVIAPVDADTFTYESTNRTVEGRPEPDLGPIEIKRQPAAHTAGGAKKGP